MGIAIPSALAVQAPGPIQVDSPDPNFHIYLCFGQSNMEGFPGIEEQDRGPVDPRFRVLAAVDFPDRDRVQGQWYAAAPPLSRSHAGIGPADYFGRTLVSRLPQDVKVGVVNVSVAGCKIELFDEEEFASYAATAPGWMANIIRAYGGNPYAHLVTMAKQAQEAGVIRGILLHQGESNTGDEDWPNKVKKVYDQLIRELDLDPEDVPLLVGEVVHEDQGGVCAPMNAIINTLPQTIPTAHVVSSAGCAALRDRLHFSPAGYRALGTRYAETMLALLDPTGCVPRRGRRVGRILPLPVCPIIWATASP